MAPRKKKSIVKNGTNPASTQSLAQNAAEVIVVAITGFIEALAVVVARIVVVMIFAASLLFPAMLVTWLLDGPKMITFVALYSFAAFALIFTLQSIQYFTMLKTGATNISDTSLLDNFPRLAQLIAGILIVPLLPVVFVYLFVEKIIPAKHFTRMVGYDMLFMYFLAVYLFAIGSYCAGIDWQLSDYMFASSPPKSIAEGFKFTLDFVFQGLLFDFLDHFQIRLSPAVLSNHLVGRILTYMLQILSSAFVISIVIDLIYDTKRRLRDVL